MRISALIDRPVLLLGGGREGQATLALLRARGHRGEVLLLADQAPAQPLEGAAWLDPARLDPLLRPGTIVVRSPGFAPAHPLRRRLDASPVTQTTATRIALAELAAAGIAVIGVTASKGKSTISTLTQLLLQAAGVPAQLAGNIGVPVLSRLDDMIAAKTPVVMEISSYQCADLPEAGGPAQAVFGRLFPEHLDWHGDLAGYYGAKARLLACAPPGGLLQVDWRSRAVAGAQPLQAPLARTDVEIEWVNRPGQGLHTAADGIHDGKERLLDTELVRLPGRHNRENACLAFAAARRHGARPADLAEVLAGFAGLPYRLQDEGVHGDIRWINDSISTAPEAACAGLEALGGAAATLIAGGQDRGYDYAPLAQALRDWQVRTLVVLPESGPAIAAAVHHLLQPGEAPRVIEATSLAEAVAAAASATPAGASCLFSPAAPSYHNWSGFEARGREFSQLVAGLG